MRARLTRTCQPVRLSFALCLVKFRIRVRVAVLAQGVQLRNGNAKEGIEHVDRQVCSRASYRVLHDTCHASRRLHGLSAKVAPRLCAAGGSYWRMLHALFGMLYVAYLLWPPAGPPVMLYFDATRCISRAMPGVASACLCACPRRSTIAVWRCDSASCQLHRAYHVSCRSHRLHGRCHAACYTPSVNFMVQMRGDRHERRGVAACEWAAGLCRAFQVIHLSSNNDRLQ